MTLMLLSFSTSAWSCGFYVGAGLGPEATDFKQSSTIVSPGSFNVKNTTHFSGTGFFGSLFGGYAWNQKQFYLAGEANINMSSLDFQASNDEFIHSSFSETHYKMQHEVGLSILPGYLFTNTTLFYGRLGYANGNFKISTTDTSLTNINRNLSGFRYGLGMNQTITQHFSVRMEYSHIDYQNTSFTVVDGAVTKNTSISPKTDQVEFGLVYNFS